MGFGIFDKYIGKCLDLSVVDEYMLNLALKHNLPNPQSIDVYGLDGLITHHSNGFYTGFYYYGEENDFLGIAFSILLNDNDIGKSNTMVSYALIVKDGKVYYDKKL